MLKNLLDIDKAVRDLVTTSILYIVKRKITNESYRDLQHLWAYHQWMIDYAYIQAMIKEYFENVMTDRNAEVDWQMSEFQKTNVMYQENIVWDWSPVMCILHEQ